MPTKRICQGINGYTKELKGTSVGTAYMITHTLIKDHILKAFSNVYVREAYYSKVGQRRYDLRNKNCDTCKVKSCSTQQKKDKDTFSVSELIYNKFSLLSEDSKEFCSALIRREKLC